MSTVKDDLEYEDYSMMCLLPNEVLSHIFALLQLEDRKSVRLVCRSWYNLSTISSITKNEKFLFRTNYNFEDIVKVMLKPDFTSLNLEFQYVSTDDLSENIWKLCGHRIHSLRFYACLGSDETVKRIIVHCVNLISIEVNSYGKEEISCSSQLLDELVEKRIRRPKLHTFTMFTDDRLWETAQHKIFIIFPRLKHFAARTISHDCFPYFPSTLESLTFTEGATLSEQSWLRSSIAKAEQGLRLKHFMGTFNENLLSTHKHLVTAFFSSQKDLIAIKLQLEYCNIKDTSKLIFHILESCPRLQEFHVEYDLSDHLLIKWKIFPRFLHLISKLKCLRLRFTVLQQTLNYRQPSPPNFSLTTLEFYSSITPSLCPILFKHCPQLLHLKLHECFADDTLQSIFKYLLKLQTLILMHSCSYFTSYGFTGRDASKERGYSIKRLEQLKHLEIRCFDGMEHNIGEIVQEFQFPQLKFLDLGIKLHMLSEELLICLSSQVPKLRELHFINYSKTDFAEKIIQFCKHSKNLYLLRIYPIYYEDVHEQVAEIFGACPSLRYVEDYFAVSSFDPFTNKVRMNTDLAELKFQQETRIFGDKNICNLSNRICDYF